MEKDGTCCLDLLRQDPERRAEDREGGGPHPGSTKMRSGQQSGPRVSRGPILEPSPLTEAGQGAAQVLGGPRLERWVGSAETALRPGTPGPGASSFPCRPAHLLSWGPNPLPRGCLLAHGHCCGVLRLGTLLRSTGVAFGGGSSRLGCRTLGKWRVRCRWWFPSGTRTLWGPRAAEDAGNVPVPRRSGGVWLTLPPVRAGSARARGAGPPAAPSPPWGPSLVTDRAIVEPREATGGALGAPPPQRASRSGRGRSGRGSEPWSLLICVSKRRASCQPSPSERQPRRRPPRTG